MRLIDKDRCKADIEQFNRPLCDGYHMKDYVLNQIITDIENQPMVDAVPVIRCRNCEYYCGRLCTAHDAPGDYLTPDDFCSWAQPKKGRK